MALSLAESRALAVKWGLESGTDPDSPWHYPYEPNSPALSQAEVIHRLSVERHMSERGIRATYDRFARKPKVVKLRGASASEAAGFARRSRSTIYRWLAQGKIKGVKAGRRWDIDTSSLTSYLVALKEKKESH